MEEEVVRLQAEIAQLQAELATALALIAQLRDQVARLTQQKTPPPPFVKANTATAAPALQKDDKHAGPQTTGRVGAPRPQRLCGMPMNGVLIAGMLCGAVTSLIGAGTLSVMLVVERAWG